MLALRMPAETLPQVGHLRDFPTRAPDFLKIRNRCLSLSAFNARFCARLAAVSVLESRPRERALERSEATKP
jgi:hypothetical protein